MTLALFYLISFFSMVLIRALKSNKFADGLREVQ
jgi:hypothetical protein